MLLVHRIGRMVLCVGRRYGKNLKYPLMGMKAVFGNKLIQVVSIYVHILLSWRSIITFGLCVFGTVLYYSISWMSLQLLWARVIVEILELSGYLALRINNDIFMGSAAIRIGSECTYIPLILIGLPLVWRGDHLVRDVLRIIFFIGIVLVANAVRLYLTIVRLAEGVPWEYAHNLVNHVTYGPILALLVFLWLKAMRLRLARKSEVIHNNSEKQP